MYGTFSWRRGRFTIWNLGRLAALVMALGGCSMILMRGADPQQAYEQEPDCSETTVPIAIDGTIGTTAAATLAEMANNDIPVDSSAGAVMLVASLVFTMSAALGAARYNECREARASWYAEGAIRESRALADRTARRAGGPRDPVPIRRGYFCTRSTSRPGIGLCVREREACERARSRLGIRDREPCEPREVMWCFADGERTRCFGTPQACAEVLARSPSTTARCKERP